MTFEQKSSLLIDATAITKRWQQYEKTIPGILSRIRKEQQHGIIENTSTLCDSCGKQKAIRASYVSVELRKSEEDDPGESFYMVLLHLKTCKKCIEQLAGTVSSHDLYSVSYLGATLVGVAFALFVPAGLPFDLGKTYAGSGAVMSGILNLGVMLLVLATAVGLALSPLHLFQSSILVYRARKKHDYNKLTNKNIWRSFKVLAEKTFQAAHALSIPIPKGLVYLSSADNIEGHTYEVTGVGESIADAIPGKWIGRVRDKFGIKVMPEAAEAKLDFWVIMKSDMMKFITAITTSICVGIGYVWLDDFSNDSILICSAFTTFLCIIFVVWIEALKLESYKKMIDGAGDILLSSSRKKLNRQRLYFFVLPSFVVSISLIIVTVWLSLLN